MIPHLLFRGVDLKVLAHWFTDCWRVCVPGWSLLCLALTKSMFRASRLVCTLLQVFLRFFLLLWNTSLTQCRMHIVFHLHCVPAAHAYPIFVLVGERVHIPECQATLTFLEANHCPGAAVITIENHVNGEVLLHTGDFRFTRDMLQYPPLRPFVRTNRLPNLLAARGTSSDSAERPEPPACPSLAAVYLDTTYCDPRYLLPTQDDAVAAVVREVNAARIEGAGCVMIPVA